MNILLFILLLVHTVFPIRIVSLGPSVTNQIVELGEAESIVGNTVYCTYNSDSCQKIGSLLNVDVEKIIALNPDIVFSVSLTPPQTIELLKKSGLNVVLIKDPSTFDMLCDNCLKIGMEIKKKDVAEKRILQARSILKSVQKKHINRTKPRVFLEIGSSPLYTVIKNSLGNSYIELAGGQNIFSLEKNGSISREVVLKANPDIILITQMGLEASQEIKIWKRFKTIKAVRNKQIYIVDEYSVCSPTPFMFAKAVEKLNTYLFGCD